MIEKQIYLSPIENETNSTPIQVKWLNYDNAVLKTMNFIPPVSNETIARYKPSASYDDNNYQYTFTGWTYNRLANGNINCVAQYNVIAKTRWKKYNSTAVTYYLWNKYYRNTTYYWNEFDATPAGTETVISNENTTTHYVTFQTTSGTSVSQSNCFEMYPTKNKSSTGYYFTGTSKSSYEVSNTSSTYYFSGKATYQGYTTSQGVPRTYKRYQVTDRSANSYGKYTYCTGMSLSSWSASTIGNLYVTVWQIALSDIKGSATGQVSSTSRSAYPDNGIKSGTSKWYVYSTYVYTRGSLYGTVDSTSSTAYPSNNYSGSYWYVSNGSETRYIAGTYITDVTSTNSSAYPANGRHTDGYYYIKQ